MFRELTVFLFHRNEFNRSAVRAKAFLPSEKTGRKSVFGIFSLVEEEIWGIGTEFVAARRGDPLRGRGDFLAKNVRDSDLKLVPEPTDHPRHGNLEGWPEAKEDRKSIAQDLALAATLRMKPEPA